LPLFDKAMDSLRLIVTVLTGVVGTQADNPSTRVINMTAGSQTVFFNRYFIFPTLYPPNGKFYSGCGRQWLLIEEILGRYSGQGYPALYTGL
jgi:hypothetical protein